MKKYFLTGILILNILFFCSTQKQPFEAEIYTKNNINITINSSSQVLSLSNKTGQTIYYTIIPLSILPLIDWAPCTSPGICENGIDNGKSINLPYSNFLGTNTDEETAVVYWWWLEKQPDGSYQIGEFEYIHVDL